MNFSLTQWIVIATIVLLLAYDGIVAYIGQETESMALRNWGQKYCWFPWTGGFLACHWWVNVDQPLGMGWMVALPILVALMLWDYWWTKNRPGMKVFYRYPGLWLAIGGICGALLWSQHP